MKQKFLFIVLFFFLCQACDAQFNYFAGLASNSPGNISIISTGNVITTNYDGNAMASENENSAIQDIGFNFIFNGSVFTKFVLNTNGFIKLGTSRPVADNYDVLNSADINTIAPFNCHTQGGFNFPSEYRVLTSGNAGARICTIQYKNITAAFDPHDIYVQIKLYESSNKIEFYYSLPSLGPWFDVNLIIGIKGNTSVNSVNVNKTIIQPWSEAQFINGPYPGNSTTIQQYDYPSLSARTFQFNCAQDQQFTYNKGASSYIAGVYTDLASNGTAITTNYDGAAMTFSDDNSSIQNIGFNFNYNGLSFTNFVLNTNGFIKLGTSKPIDQFNVLSSTDSNTIAPFNLDLEGIGTAEYRVFTNGAAGSRICTIQFKNIREKNTPRQYNSINFQIKLYEGSNRIEFIYGAFAASVQAAAPIQVITGIKGNGPSASVNATKTGTQAWSAVQFINGNYTSNKFNNQNNFLPVSGATFRFSNVLNDASVGIIYTLSQLPVISGVPDTVKARIYNNTTNAINNVPVSLQISGANSFTNSKMVSLGAFENAVVDFTPFTSTILGTNTVTVSIPSDDNNTNNTLSLSQVVNNQQLYSYADGAAIAGWDSISGYYIKRLVKYKVNGFAKVTKVNINLNGSTGHTVYAVVLNAAGEMLGKSANYVITAGDIGNYKSFDILFPPSFYNSYIYVGLALDFVPGGANGKGAVSFQAEPSQTLPGIYYGTADDSYNPQPVELFSNKRYMIQAVVTAFTPPTNDVKVEGVYTLGKIPKPLGVYAHVIRARITNAGATPKTDLNVTLNITGANTFTNTKLITLAPQETRTINFDAFSSWNLGNNTVTVSVPADDINTNNSATYNQSVNSDTFSYADNSVPAGSRGFGKGAGILSVLYTPIGPAIINKVRVHISNNASNVGNTIYAVIDNSVASAAHVITAPELNTYITLNITSPPEYSYGFHVGIQQTANATTGYFPVSYQNEGNSTRSGAYYTSAVGSGYYTEATDSGRFMIEAIVSIGTELPEYSTASAFDMALASWDFSGLNSPVSLGATYYDSSLSFQPVLTRGSGAPSSPGVHNFRTTGFQNDGISVTNNDYFQVSISPKPGQTISLTTISCFQHGTDDIIRTTGVSSQFAYSTNGTNFTLLGTPLTTYDMISGGYASLSGIAALQNITSGTTITFRYYASGEGATSDWGFVSAIAGEPGLTISGKFISANTISTTPIVPTGADYIFNACNSTLPGSISFTSTGTFSATNKYVVEVGEVYTVHPPTYRFRDIVTAGSLSSNANSGTVNFTIPSGLKGNVLRIVSTDPRVYGSFSQLFAISDPDCASSRYGEFRSKQSGDWNNINTWEYKNPSGIWVPSTIIPDYHAASIEIVYGHTVTITTNVSTSNGMVRGTLQLLNDNTNHGTLSIQPPSPNGPGRKPFLVDTSGVFQLLSSVGTYNDVIINYDGRAFIGGTVKIGDGIISIAAGFDDFGISGDFFWYNGSVLEWNTINGAQPRTDTIYFPNAGSNKSIAAVDPIRSPTLRITNVPNPNLGGTANTTVNGLLEANTPITWVGSGTKTFTDGIQGSSTVTQDAGSGEFFTTSAFTTFPATDTSVAALKGVINGTVNVNLNNSSGYTLVNGATVPDTADVHLSSGITRSYEKVEVQVGGHLTIDNLGGGLLATDPSELNLLNADLVNRGTITGPGVIKFTGSQVSHLNSPGIITAPILLINKEVVLTGNSNTASIDLTLNSHLTLDSFHLKMGAAPLNADNANFIVTNDTGRLIRNVATSPVDFAIGNNTSSYTPVTLTNSGTAADFRVRVKPGVSFVLPLDQGNVDRTWFIDSTQGGSILSVKAQWNLNNEQPGFDRNNCFLSQSHGCQPPPNCIDTYYDASGRTAATGSDPYFQVRSAVTGPTSFIVKSSADTSTFTGNAGNGLWNDPNNWTIGVVPSQTIANGKIIVINYTNGVPCTAIGNIIIQPGGQLIINPTKILTVTGNIINQ